MIDDALEAYVEAHTTPAPPELVALDHETRAALPWPEMLSGPVVGRLLETLVWLARPSRVLEIGTYSGGSALWMARGLPDGATITSLELSEEHAAFARRHIEAAGLADRVSVVVGPALDTLATLDGPFDLVFLDADKPGYVGYLDAVLPKLADGGLVVADNTLRSGRVLDPQNEGDRAIAAFNDRVVDDPALVCVQLSVRDGVTLLRKA